MCNIVGIGAAIALTQTALQVTSGIQQANAQKAQYEYEAQIARNNAKIAQQNADQKRQEGIEEARMLKMKSIQNANSQKAAIASNNIDVNSGNSLNIINDTLTMGELDALNTRYNYETSALNFEQQANNYNNKARLNSIAERNINTPLNVLGTTLRGLSNASAVASKWYNANSLAAKT